MAFGWRRRSGKMKGRDDLPRKGGLVHANKLVVCCISSAWQWGEKGFFYKSPALAYNE